MNNKYYTPEIEEFHPGFKYEVKDFHDNLVDYVWKEETMGIGCDFVLDELLGGDIRVKHLDREDIESLGWVYDKTYPGLNEDMFTTEEYILDYDYDSKYCRIYWRENNGDVTRFSGTIKNKSVLKQVLKMIGV